MKVLFVSIYYKIFKSIGLNMMARQKKYFRSMGCSSSYYSIINCKERRQELEESEASGKKFNHQYSIKADQKVRILFTSPYYKIPINKLEVFFVCFLAYFSIDSPSLFELTLEPSTGSALQLCFFIQKSTWQNLQVNLGIQTIPKELYFNSTGSNQVDENQLLIAEDCDQKQALFFLTRCFHLKPGIHILLLRELANLHQKHLQEIYQLLLPHSLRLEKLAGEYFSLEVGSIQGQPQQPQSQPQAYFLTSELVHTLEESLTLDVTNQRTVQQNLRDVYHGQLRRGTLEMSKSRGESQVRTLLKIKCSSRALVLNVLKFLFEEGVQDNIIWRDDIQLRELQSSNYLFPAQQRVNMLEHGSATNQQKPLIPLLSNEKRFKALINKLRTGNIRALKSYWDKGLAAQLELMLGLDCSELYGNIEEQLRVFFQLVDYWMARYNVNLKSDDANKVMFWRCTRKIPEGRSGKRSDYYNRSSNLYELLYSGIYKLSKLYFEKVNGRTFWEGWENYKSDAMKTNKSITIDKLAQSYHQDFLKEFNIQENYLDQILEKQILNLCKEHNTARIIIEPEKLRPSDRQTIFQTSAWKDTLTIVQYLAQESKKEQKRGKGPKKNKMDYLKELENEKLVENRCLGCATFFYEDFDILDHSVLQTPLTAYESIRNLRGIEAELKQQICGLLNGSGGIILFGCTKGTSEIRTTGEDITEVEKEEYEQRIAFFTRSFYPKVEIKQNIELTFVPVRENPYKVPLLFVKEGYTGEQAWYKGDQTFWKREFIKGRYVARLRVRSTQDSVYFWKNQEGRYYSAIEKNKQVEKLTINQMIKEMKRRTKNKFRRYQSGSNSEACEGGLLQSPRCCLSHVCLSPEAGHKISGREQRSKVPKQTNENLYKYMTMLIIRQKNIKEVEAIFKELGVNCVILKQFLWDNQEKKGPYSAKDTAVMYHNQHFSDLLTLTAKNKQKFILDGKKLLMISISEYIKIIYNEDSLVFPLEQERMVYYQKYLAAAIPGEKIRFYTYHTNMKKEFYAQANTKLGNLLMYYIMNEDRIKAIFKNPKDLATLSDSDKQKRWEQAQYSTHSLL